MGQVINWFRRQGGKIKTDIEIHPTPYRIWCIFTSNLKNLQIPSNEILVKVFLFVRKQRGQKGFVVM